MSAPPDCKNRELSDLLTGYELGLLDDVDRLAVERHLAECAACTESLYRSAPDAVVMTGAPGDVLRGSGASATPSGRNEKGPRWLELLRDGVGRRWLPVLVPAAAGLAIALFVLQSRDSATLADLARLDPLPWTQIDVRTTETEVTAAFDTGMVHYADGQYALAIPPLRQAIERGGDEWSDAARAHLYLGIALLHVDDPVNAIPELESARTSSVRPIAEPATWFLVQAHLLLEDSSSARARLADLRESPVYGDRAKTLMMELDAFTPAGK